MREYNQYRQRDQRISFQINIEEQKLITLWLAGILHQSQKWKVSLDLNRNTVSGIKKDCMEFLKEVKNYSSNFAVIAIPWIDEPKKQILSNRYGCRVYDNENIKKIIGQINRVFPSQRLIQLSHKQFHIVQTKKRFQQQVTNSISKIKDPRFNKSKKKQDKFPSVSLRKERNERQIVYNQDFPIQQISIQHFKEWRKDNLFDEQDLKLVKTNSVLQIVFQPLKKDKTPQIIKSFNQHFKFPKKIIFRRISQKNEQALQRKFCIQNSRSYLVCKFITGDWDPDIPQSQLRQRIQIPRQNNRRDPMACLWIQGLKPFVESKHKEVLQFLDSQHQQQELQIKCKEIQKFKLNCTQESFHNILSRIVEQVISSFSRIYLREELILVESGLKIKLDINFFLFKDRDLFEQSLDKIKSQVEKKVSFVKVPQLFIPNNLNNPEQIFGSLPNTSQSGKNLLLIKSENIGQFYKYIFQEMCEEGIAQEKISFYAIFKQKINQEIQKFQKTHQGKKVKINIKQEGDKIFVSFYGFEKYVKKKLQDFQRLKKQLQEEIYIDNLYFSKEEDRILKENFKNIQNDVSEKYKVDSFLLRNPHDQIIITLGEEQKVNPFDMPLLIVIKKQCDLSSLPFGTSVAFLQNQLDYFKEEYVNTTFKKFAQNLDEGAKQYEDRGIKLIFFKKSQEILFAKIQKENPFGNEQKNRFAFVFPQNQKKGFFFEILNFFSASMIKKQIQIFLFNLDQGDYESVLDLNNHIPNKGKKWYVMDGNEKIYYEEIANQKIRKAKQKKKDSVYLFRQELNLKKITHTLDYTTKKIKHIIKENETEIKFENETAEVQVNNQKFLIGKRYVKEWSDERQSKKSDKIQIKLAIYLVDLKNKKQINIFSGYERKLYCQLPENQLKSTFHTNYQRQFSNVKLYYTKETVKNLKSIRQMIRKQVKNALKKQQITTQIKLNQKQKIKKLKTIAYENNVDISMSANNKLQLQAYSHQNINYLKHLLPMLQKALRQTEYPKEWEKQQQQIQTFEVSSDTDEFKKVQQAFTFSKIKKLIRIQNKLVFQRYYQQKQWLTSLNGGKKVQEKMLFHGTSYTNPKVIYEDKEESFNINYTSDNNFLGRGTYFAVKSQYSHSYCYKSKEEQSSNVMGSQYTYEMFYCVVITGEAQKFKNTNKSMRDTNFKDKNKRLRYQSSTMLTGGSDIYVVYKNRRAYPMYLIKYQK